MKNVLLLVSLLIMPVLLRAADGKKTVAKPVAEQREKKLNIPEGAIQVQPGAYRYTDPQGKTWIYRRTPFGLSKYEDKPVAVEPAKIPEGMKAVEDGDNVRFERPTPFGTQRWVRQKSELSDMEREAWKQAREKADGAKAGTE